MDVKNLGNNQFLVTIGPTQSNMLNEIAVKIGKEPEEVLRQFVFCTIATEHSDMQLQETIASQTEFGNH